MTHDGHASSHADHALTHAALQIVAPDGQLVGDAPELSADELKSLFVHMLKIRAVDGRMLKLQRAGRIGFVGTATGLEAALVGAAAPRAADPLRNAQSDVRPRDDVSVDVDDADLEPRPFFVTSPWRPHAHHGP